MDKETINWASGVYWQAMESRAAGHSTVRDAESLRVFSLACSILGKGETDQEYDHQAATKAHGAKQLLINRDAVEFELEDSRRFLMTLQRQYADGMMTLAGVRGAESRLDKARRAAEVITQAQRKIDGYTRHKQGRGLAVAAAVAEPAPTGRAVALAEAAETTGRFSVDAVAGVIEGAAVAHEGLAEGHGFSLDATTLQMLYDLMTRNVTTPVRWRHPVAEGGRMADAIGSQIGNAVAPYIDADGTLRATIRLGEFAHNMPKLGDVWAYLLGDGQSDGLIQSDPTSIGLSVAVKGDFVLVGVEECLRPEVLIAIDFVSDAAANPTGLL